MKPQMLRRLRSARRASLCALVASALGIAAPARAQNFDAGSDGSLGDVVVTNNTTMDLPPDGKLHFRNLTVNSGATLSFNRNERNTPVFILAQSNVLVNGTINVDGGGRAANTGGRGGPGGFDGGKPGFGPEVPAGFGYGPGGGFPGSQPISVCSGDLPSGGSYGTLGRLASTGTYGNTLLIPLVGGSGGGAGQGSSAGGGGGGGAVMIAANHRITINGTVSATGGFGGACDNAGSGGAIRLVSFAVEGAGTLTTTGGDTPNRSAPGGQGRVRIDTVIRTEINFIITGVSSIGGNLLVFPPTVPTLTVTQAAGNVVTNGSGPVVFTLPFGSSTNRTIRIRAQDFGRIVPIRVTLTPDSGTRLAFDADVDNASVNPAFIDVPVTVPVNTLVTVHCWTR